MIRKRRKRLLRKLPVTLVVILVIAFAAYAALSYIDYNSIDIGFDIDLGEINLFRIGGDGDDRDDEKQTVSAPDVIVPEDGEVVFHFIDVGQGDAILVTTSKKGGTAR